MGKIRSDEATARARQSQRERLKKGQALLPLLAPEELQRFASLWAFAKATVASFYAGKHPAPYRGGAAEFAEYKAYTPGDAPARVDWRVYGRTRRWVVRQFDQETELNVYVLLDKSGSMRFGSGPRGSKFAVAAKIAAALVYLMIGQGDQAALALYSESIERYQPPGGTRGHLQRLIAELEQALPGKGTGIVHALSQCNAMFRKRGQVVIISDFFEDSAALFEGLAQLRHRGFEILLLQVLDPVELELPAFEAAKFVDMESGEMMRVDAEEIRGAYQQEIGGRVARLAADCERRQIAYRLVDSRAPYVDALAAYLGVRGKTRGARCGLG